MKPNPGLEPCLCQGLGHLAQRGLGQVDEVVWGQGFCKDGLTGPPTNSDLTPSAMSVGPSDASSSRIPGDQDGLNLGSRKCTSAQPELSRPLPA